MSYAHHYDAIEVPDPDFGDHAGFDVVLARISHHPTTATVPCHTLWAFYSVRVLDIVSTMPAGPLVVKPIQDASFNRPATKSGEKCGLDMIVSGAQGLLDTILEKHD